MKGDKKDARTEETKSCRDVNSTSSLRKRQCRIHSIGRRQWEVMGNPRRRHERQMPFRRKVLKISVTFRTSLVTGKQNAVRKPIVLRNERSKLESEKEPQKAAIKKTENWYVSFVGTQVFLLKTATRVREMPRRTDR